MELALNLFVIFCIFVIGTLFGSFFSLATYRIPRHQDIVIKQSYCPNCKHKLGFFDLFPIFSYILCGAKCRYCKKKISPRYFLLELSNGCVFLVFYAIFGYTLNFMYVAIIYAVLFVLIGSYVMSLKMTDEEKEQVKKIDELKKNKKIKENKLDDVSKKDYDKKENIADTSDLLSRKSGVFVTEIIIAVLLFAILMVTSFVLSKNSASINAKNIIESNANMIAVKNMEICLATQYDKLGSYNLQEKRGSTTYSVETTISSIADQDFTKEDVIKNVEVKVTYMYDGSLCEVVLNSVKGKVL